VRLGGVAIFHIASSLKNQQRASQDLCAYFTPNKRLQVERLRGHWRHWRLTSL